jgi:hypothetical protein
LSANGASVEKDATTGILKINRDFQASLVIARCQTCHHNHLRWLIRLEQSIDCDITIAARMSQDNSQILDYYLLPRGEVLSARIRLAPENPLVLDV